MQLIASVLPTNATNTSVSWDSDNTSVATVNSSGLVTAVAAGTAAITVTTEDGRKTATATATVYVPTSVEMSNCDVGLPEEFGILEIHPNPFNPSTTIRYQLPVTSHVTLDVYDMLGRIVASLVNGTREAGYHTAVFGGSALSSGIFYARMAAQTQAGKGVSRTAKLLLVK